MKLWELEARTGYRFSLDNLGPELAAIVVRERQKRMNVNSIGSYEATLLQAFANWSKAREEELVQALSNGQSYEPYDRALSQFMANFSEAHSADLRRVIYELDAEHRSEEHTSELQSREKLVCRLLREKKNSKIS